MPTLIMKILKENPAPLPNHYSADLQSLIKSMLTKSPSLRPSVADLLQLPFIKAHMATSVADHQKVKQYVNPSLVCVLRLLLLIGPLSLQACPVLVVPLTM